MKWGKGWEVSANREIDAQQRTRMLADIYAPTQTRAALDAQRASYLRKKCTCGSGLGDGLCANCWPV